MQEWNEASMNGDGIATEQNSLQGPRILEAPERDTSNPEAFVTELGGPGQFFTAHGTAELRIGTQIHTFKIRSVPNDAWERMQELFRPKPWPQRWDKKQERYIDDFDHPAILKYFRILSYAKVLLGLSEFTLRNQHGTIVWQEPGGIRETAAAIQALKDQGITQLHVDSLTKAIDALSRHEQEQEAAHLLGESDDDLASP